MSKPLYSIVPDGLGEVMVYRNLTKNCWSIKSLNTNRVVCHAMVVFMPFATFKVSEKVRQRVLRERKKYVHAGGIGTPKMFHKGDKFTQISYNPYKHSTFVDLLGNPVHSAKDVVFERDGRVFAYESSMLA
jgi:hypothetical protein